MLVNFFFHFFSAAAEKQVKKNYYEFINKSIYYLKIVGLWDFSLHELVIHERIEVIDKRINEITVGRKAQPALLNQYNTEGKINE